MCSGLGKNVYSRYLTLTEEQEERVALLLDAEDPDVGKPRKRCSMFWFCVCGAFWCWVLLG